MATTAEHKSEIIFLDDDGNVVPKEKATACHILEFDANGERVRETYGVLKTDEGEEVS